MACLEDEASAGNPGNSNDDVVDLVPPVPVPEDEEELEPAAAVPAPRGPVVQEFDLMLANPTDHVLFHLGAFPSELRSGILRHGPCHPKGPFAICSANGNSHIFLGKHYHAHYGALEIEWQYLCFSPTTKTPHCESCWLFGDPSAMQKEWANGVLGNPQNFGVKIGRWKAGQYGPMH